MKTTTNNVEHVVFNSPMDEALSRIPHASQAKKAANDVRAKTCESMIKGIGEAIAKAMAVGDLEIDWSAIYPSVREALQARGYRVEQRQDGPNETVWKISWD